jgi:xanthine dehydrogenase/oxidase
LNLTIPPTTAATALSSASSTTAPRISFSSFKLARRQQNAHALVNLAACLTIDPSTDKIATATVYLHADDAKVPRLVHACGTCDSLIGSVASSQATLTAALSALCKDLAAASGGGALPVQPYTAAAAQALLFKALLAAQAQGALPSDLVSAANWQLPRKVSTGSDVWYPPSASDEPLPAGQGMTKIRAPLQCTGQAKYATDFSAGTRRGLLHAAPIQSTRALATLSKFDPSIALSMPGVVDVVTADDIDVAGGAVNNCGADASDNGGNNSPEEIFVPLPTSASASASASDSVSSSSSPSPTTGGKVQFVGQTLAIVVALTQEQARAAARVMMDPTSGAVAYADCEGETPIFTIDDAIAANAFYEGSHCALVERLQPGVKSIDDALDASQHTWHGSLYFSGQRHFYMETQRAVVYPTEDDGLLVRSSTQGPTVVAKYVARATGLRMHNVEAKQVRAGGAFGGKLTRDLPVACAAAVAARKLGAPVSLVLDRVGDQQVTGGREPIRMDISVGFDADAGHSAAGSANASSPTVRAFKLALFMNGGWTLDGTFGDLDMGTQWSDNAYNVPNFHCESKAVRTNTPSTTSMRAPGVLHAVVAIETAFEHVAAALDIDVDDLRADHFYRVGDKTPYGQTIEYDSLPQCWSQVQAQSDYAAAQAVCAAFNKANRWVKRAAALAPAKYGIGWDSTQSGCTVNVYGPDGSIVIQHGGCELGQGLNTKVAQAAASALGLDCSTTDLARLVRTDATSSRTVPNNGMTGGSSTSEVTCQAVMNACAVLVKRLAPYRDPPSKGGKGLSWEAACAAACGDRVQLSADGWFAPPAAVPGLDFSFRYFVYAAAVTVVELDVLTGQAQILRTDVVYDCGQSLNPVVDVGQIEGGFVMGIGTWLTEEASPGSDGGLLQNGTWEYKPPCSKDIPVVFNCTLLRDNPNVKGVLGSKATAEPPMILTNSVYFALRKCIAAARAANGMAAADARTFALAAPATAERVVAAIGTQPASDFRM